MNKTYPIKSHKQSNKLGIIKETGKQIDKTQTQTQTQEFFELK
jgi:hypothetical protein